MLTTEWAGEPKVTFITIEKASNGWIVGQDGKKVLFTRMVNLLEELDARLTLTKEK